MQNIKLALIQTSLFWESQELNLEHLAKKINDISETVDLIVLPEMFASGFTMNPHGVAESMDGSGVEWMANQAAERSCVVTGSLIIKEGERYFNRLIWMQPDGRYSYYDKAHLFSYAGEGKHFTRGHEKLIVSLKGWKFMPLICYDLRFPVWSRNRHQEGRGFDYDCLLYVANWPASRSHAWRILLMARAIENMCYVVGVNRIGTDGNDIDHSGDSVAIDPLGESLTALLPNADKTEVVNLTSCLLNSHREQFRAWSDWDTF